MFLSKDLGTTWTELAIPNQLAIVDLLFDPDLPSVLYAPSTGPMPVLNVSDDAGVSWRTIRNPDNHYYLNRMALLSRQCGGGGLFSVSGSSFDFGATWQPGQISRVIVVAAGPGCAIYAIRSIASDAFIAKLAPGGSEVIWSTYLGGSDTDASAALALDAQGNVYVAGNTASADFPTTAPLAGSMGHVFVVKLDPDGKLIYSVIYGGESTDAAAALAVNGSGEAHLVGWLGAGANGGAFLIKLRRDGSTAYVSYLPKIATYEYQPLSLNPPRAIAVIAEENGSVLIGGYAGMLLRMNPDGYLLSDLPRLPGRIFAMETDDKGNIYVAGQVTGYGSGVRSKGCFEGYYYHSPSTLAAGDIFVTKLKPDSLQEVFSARLFGDCQSWPSTIKVGPTGEITVGLWTFSNFPVRYPVLASLSCYVNGAAAVSRHSADGSTLLFSSFLDMCVNAPLVAHAPDGSIYAGVAKAISPYTISTHSAILRIPFPQPDSLAIEKVVNAFSGVPGFPSDGMLLTITGQNLAAKFIDLGLNNPNPLPTELGGVQVLFDGVAAQMLQVAPDRLICVLPPKTQNQNTVNIQVVNGPQRSSPSVQRLFLAGVGLLTHYFPALPPSGSVDGVILNADGTLNDAQHPAAPGSTVVLFGTGVTGPGSIPLLWNAPQQKQNETIYPLLGTARHMPGFIDAMYAIDFRIPDAPGPGVYVVPVRGRLTRMEIGLAGSGIGVWVK